MHCRHFILVTKATQIKTINSAEVGHTKNPVCIECGRNKLYTCVIANVTSKIVHFYKNQQNTVLQTLHIYKFSKVFMQALLMHPFLAFRVGTFHPAV